MQLVCVNYWYDDRKLEIIIVYINTTAVYYAGRKQLIKPQRKYDSQNPFLYPFTEVSPESKMDLQLYYFFHYGQCMCPHLFM